MGIPGSSSCNVISTSAVGLLIVVVSTASFFAGIFFATSYDPASLCSRLTQSDELSMTDPTTMRSAEELIMKSEEDPAIGFSEAHVAVERWQSWTTRAGEWYVNETIQEADPNWSGRRAMHEVLSNGSIWWDEAAENYFLAKIEEVQYPTNCSQVHLFGHRSWSAGMLSNVHQLAQPLLLAVMRGHTIVDIDRHDLWGPNPAFFGCSPGFHNLNCFLNLSTCSPIDVEDTLNDRVRSIADKIMARYSENGRPAWTPPVLTIHIRQSDKQQEDPFWMANGRYRNVSEDTGPMKQLESEFGFKWPTVFLMSDSGSTLVEVAREINSFPDDVDPLSMYNSSAAAGQDGKRLIMYDWTSDIHIIQKYGNHVKYTEGNETRPGRAFSSNNVHYSDD
ncbi:hypothetical protein R1sor_027485 [Riccia sorocarpa]|uniref:Fucosyltransferase n=1 Tax=Riccia sorocarpa TaxID=122646 RepID=A0ABD3GEB7_9MARC